MQGSIERSAWLLKKPTRLFYCRQKHKEKKIILWVSLSRAVQSSLFTPPQYLFLLTSCYQTTPQQQCTIMTLLENFTHLSKDLLNSETESTSHLTTPPSLYHILIRITHSWYLENIYLKVNSGAFHQS